MARSIQGTKAIDEIMNRAVLSDVHPWHLAFPYLCQEFNANVVSTGV